MRVTSLFRKGVSLILALLITLSVLPALAATPKPIEVIPYDEIAPTVDGQHHYLLLCTDVWYGNPKNLGNTDGIIILTLDTRAHRVMLTSIIRDALVARVEDGKEGIGRITYIAKRSGPEYLCQVISQHLNIKLDKYIVFDFNKIQKIIDARGGVDVTLDSSEVEYLRRYAIRSGTTPALSRPGLYHFEGHPAVIYMRIRKASGHGDFMRTQRVRNVLSAMADDCRNITYDEAKELVNVIVENNVMTNMNLEEMLEAMDYAYGLKDCTIEELRIPKEEDASPISYAGMSVQEINWAGCRDDLAYYLQNSFLVIDDEDD